jgi:hypothetical protein
VIIRSFQLALIGLIGAGLLTCCSSTPEKTIENTEAEAPVAEEPEDPDGQEKSSIPRGNADPLTASSNSSSAPHPEASFCSGPDFNLQAHLKAFARDIERQKIMYDSEPLSKCSGMFLRTCRVVAEACPGARFRNLEAEASTRDEAIWFEKQNRLLLIEDAANSGHMIRPGSVLFFGYQGKKYQKGVDLDMETLSPPGKGIEHMGVVTDVTQENGQVVSYRMFHGRSAGKPAAITTHYRNPNSRSSSRNDLPAYGNWDQQWVAIAYILGK